MLSTCLSGVPSLYCSVHRRPALGKPHRGPYAVSLDHLAVIILGIQDVHVMLTNGHRVL